MLNHSHILLIFLHYSLFPYNFSVFRVQFFSQSEKALFTFGCLLCLLFPSSSDSESGSQLPCDQLVSPIALAACTRVDSCFAPWFVPSLGVSLQLAQLDIHLCHHLERLGTGRIQNTNHKVSS